MTRHIDFEGILNFRDFGGYDTACGRGLKAGRLFRSANHARATDADLERLASLGVTAIVDLRRPDERRRDPSRRWPGFAAQVLENDLHENRTNWLVTLDAGDLSPEWFHQDALAFYAYAPFDHCYVEIFSRYFQTLAETEGAVVVHCAAGKDRTGIVCALTQHIAGVHPDDILHDYLLTNDEARIAEKIAFLGPWMEEQLGRRPTDEALRVAATVATDQLEAAFRAMAERHGSVDGYLEQVLGVDGAMRARLHDRLLGA